MASVQDINDKTCVVCFKNIDFYSIGECDHPVCYECSTRMRVLCLQNECPICRQDLAKVVFTTELQPFKKLKNEDYDSNKHFEKKFKIIFKSDEVYNAYLKLLEHRCKMCENVMIFKSFESLNDHIKKEHELFYCELCVLHLKIFTFERKCYNRRTLAMHRRKGDTDDTSHRGHPLCEFCQQRYMDNDDLFRHLRKQHLYCHLCDMDGLQYYYETHTHLFDHYRKDHFLCEEGECHDQHLTAVFRTEIDLKAHKAQVHGRGLPRAAARQARTLEWHFSLAPRPPPNFNRPNGYQQQREQRPPSAAEAPEPPMEEEPIYQAPPPKIDPLSAQDFPSLSGSAAAAHVPLTNIVPPRGGRCKQGYNANFPALDGPGAAAPSQPSQPSQSSQSSQSSQPSVRFDITHRHTVDGPSPAVIRTSSKPNLSVQVQGRRPTADDFRLTKPSTSRLTGPAASMLEDDFPSLSMCDNHPSVGASAPQKAKIALVNRQDFESDRSVQSNRPKVPPPSRSAEAFPALSASAAAPPVPAWITVKKDKPKKSKAASPPTLPPPPENFDPVADFPTLKTKAKNKKTAVNDNNNYTQNDAPIEEPKLETEKKQQNGKKKKKGKENFVSADGFAELEASNKNRADNFKRNTYVDAAARSEREASTRNGNAAPAVPPGFAAIPPGFSPAALRGDDGADGKPHSFAPPPDFDSRNRRLVEELAAILCDADMIGEFKRASRSFREGAVSGEAYYELCRALTGGAFERLFPELAALLPDLRKQRELQLVRRLRGEAPLPACGVCGQVLRPADGAAHAAKHWPALAGPAPSRRR